MNAGDEKKLDNPVWNSLSEFHKNFSFDYGNTKLYNPEYCPFGGFTEPANTKEALDKYGLLIENFFIVGGKPTISDSLKIARELICLQMVIYKKIDLQIETEIIKLTENHNDALRELINLVQPGYFKNKTSLLGHYYGIFKEGQLIAVTGERMKMYNFTEVSAIVTHPDHTGKGYAKQLIAHAVNAIFDENKIPYLHVVDSNIGAIRLYEKLGFVTRRKMSFWNIIK